MGFFAGAQPILLLTPLTPSAACPACGQPFDNFFRHDCIFHDGEVIAFSTTEKFMARASRTVRALAILTGLACFATAAVGESSLPPASLPAYQRLLSLMPPGISFPSYQLRLRIEFQRLDADGNGEFDTADIELHAAAEMASLRIAATIAKIMRHDLNGDGFVTEDELRKSLNYQTRNARYQGQQTQEKVEAFVLSLMATDVDKDGRITFEEVLALAKAQFSTGIRRNVEPHTLQMMLGLAGEGGNKITLAQFEAAGEAVFRAVDTDKNDLISQDELAAYRGQLKAQAQRLRPQ
jgi:EF hand